MKIFVVAAILMAFVSPAPFCVARDATSDVLRLEAKARQTQYQKDAARLKAVEDEAARSTKGRMGQATQVPHM